MAGAAAIGRLLSRYRHLPSARLCRRASSKVTYPLQLSSVSADHASLYEESLQNPDRFWGDLARSRLTWFKDFDQVMDCDMEQGRISWFNGGKINVSGKRFYVGGGGGGGGCVRELATYGRVGKVFERAK